MKKIAKVAKTGAKVAKTWNGFRTKVLPWILAGGALAAYAFLNVKIPERKIPEKYKETW